MTSTTVLLAIVLVQSIAAPLRPTLRVMISNLVNVDEIGSVFAAVSVLDGIGELLGPFAMSFVYSATLSTYSAAVFILVASVYTLGLAATYLGRISVSDEIEQAEPC